MTKIKFEEISKCDFLTDYHLTNIFRRNTKFYLPDSDRQWYIVSKCLNEDYDLLMIYKSWDEESERWEYKVNNIFSLLCDLAKCGELYLNYRSKFVIINKPPKKV